ncbi:hypothetical protein M569_10065, partial [Genlisea aurea]
FPLASRSGRIRKRVTELRNSSEKPKIRLADVPGGVESFILAAQFCYGTHFEIGASNVAEICCVSSYLEMSEVYSVNNLSLVSDEHLEIIINKDSESAVEVLRHCADLLPLADELKIVARCIDSVVSEALLSCRFPDGLSLLRIDLFRRVISAMRCRGVKPECIGASLVNYAQKVLAKRSMSQQPKPVFVDSDDGITASHVVETLVGLIPNERCGVPVSFLFGLLRCAAMLGCSDCCRVDIERRIGSRLDEASVDDLLIPSFRHGSGGRETVFDVELVHRLLMNFCHRDDDDDGFSPSQIEFSKVSKLLDSYLSEIASDVNLEIHQFVAIAEALPDHARTSHDVLYRAVDVYLRGHGNLSDSEKRKVCKVINFELLSAEAGSHATQNERLPLQSIVQVLYYEQLRLRDALLLAQGADDDSKSQSWRINSGLGTPRDNYASLRMENRDLKLELARLRMRVNDLEKNHAAAMKRNSKSGGCARVITWLLKTMIVKPPTLFSNTSSSRASTPPSSSR